MPGHMTTCHAIAGLPNQAHRFSCIRYTCILPPSSPSSAVASSQVAEMSQVELEDGELQEDYTNDQSVLPTGPFIDFDAIDPVNPHNKKRGATDQGSESRRAAKRRKAVEALARARQQEQTSMNEHQQHQQHQQQHQSHRHHGGRSPVQQHAAHAGVYRNAQPSVEIKEYTAGAAPDTSPANAKLHQIRDLTLYALLGANAAQPPPWVFVKNQPLIEHVVLLLVPGLTTHLVQHHQALLPNLTALGKPATVCCNKDLTHAGDAARMLLMTHMSAKGKRGREQQSGHRPSHLQSGKAEKQAPVTFAMVERQPNTSKPQSMLAALLSAAKSTTNTKAASSTKQIAPKTSSNPFAALDKTLQPDAVTAHSDNVPQPQEEAAQQQTKTHGDNDQQQQVQKDNKIQGAGVHAELAEVLFRTGPHPPSHYLATIKQLQDNNYPLPHVDEATGRMVCPPGWVVTQPGSAEGATHKQGTNGLTASKSTPQLGSKGTVINRASSTPALAGGQISQLDYNGNDDDDSSDASRHRKRQKTGSDDGSENDTSDTSEEDGETSGQGNQIQHQLPSSGHNPVRATPANSSYVPPPPAGSPRASTTHQAGNAQNNTGNSNDDSSSYWAGEHIIAVDCEMCMTAEGFELARLTLLDADGKVLVDELVQPTNTVTDYMERFSGINAATLENVTTTLADAQEMFLRHVTAETLLVGHGIENDLRALKVLHGRILDTALLYPHPSGPPAKCALRVLTNKYLHRIIQKGAHDSAIDAQAALDLVRLKVKHGPTWGSPHHGGAAANMKKVLELVADHKHKSALVAPPHSLSRFTASTTSVVASTSDRETAQKAAGLARSHSYVVGNLTALDHWLQTRARYHSEIDTEWVLPTDKSGNSTSQAPTTTANKTPGDKSQCQSRSTSHTPSQLSSQTSDRNGNQHQGHDAGSQHTKPGVDAILRGLWSSEDAGPGQPKLADVLKGCDACIGAAWAALPPRTLMVVVSGCGDVYEWRRYQEQMYKRRNHMEVPMYVGWNMAADSAYNALAEQQRRTPAWAAVKTV